MSDNAAEFRRKTDAMFRRTRHQVHEIGLTFAGLIMEDAVVLTRGPGNQIPENTSYDATGRLRAGWNWLSAPLGVASRWTGGPYDEAEYGSETVEKLRQELHTTQMGGHLYLGNDVAYGWEVHYGGGRAEAYPWLNDVESRQRAYASDAMHVVMSR